MDKRKEKQYLLSKYYIHGIIFPNIKSAKYIGINITSDTSWRTHIGSIYAIKPTTRQPFTRKSSTPLPKVLKHSLTKLQLDLCKHILPSYGMHYRKHKSTHSRQSKGVLLESQWGITGEQAPEKAPVTNIGKKTKNEKCHNNVWSIIISIKYLIMETSYHHQHLPKSMSNQINCKSLTPGQTAT